MAPLRDRLSCPTLPQRSRNFVVQKLFEVGTEEQHSSLVSKVKGSILELAKDLAGFGLNFSFRTSDYSSDSYVM